MIQIMFQDDCAEVLGQGGSWADCLDLGGSVLPEGMLACGSEGLSALPHAEEECHDAK